MFGEKQTMKVEKQQEQGVKEVGEAAQCKNSGYASQRCDVGSKYPHQLTHNCLELKSWKI